MSESPDHPEDARDIGAGASADAPAGIPRWVKVFAVVGLVIIVLLVVAMLVGGNHGPGRHSGGEAAPTMPVSATQPGGGHRPSDAGHEPPSGGHAP